MSELEMERSMEELERQAATKMSTILKTNEENDDVDDGVICDVCRSVRKAKIGLKSADGANNYMTKHCTDCFKYAPVYVLKMVC